MLRDLVLPRVLEYFVDILEWVKACCFIVKVFLLRCKMLSVIVVLIGKITKHHATY